MPSARFVNVGLLFFIHPICTANCSANSGIKCSPKPQNHNAQATVIGCQTKHKAYFAKKQTTNSLRERQTYLILFPCSEVAVLWVQVLTFAGHNAD